MAMIDLLSEGDTLAFVLQPRSSTVSTVDAAIGRFAASLRLDGRAAAPWQLRLDLGSRAGFRGGLPRGIVAQALEAGSQHASEPAFDVVLDQLVSVRTIWGRAIALKASEPQPQLISLQARLAAACERGGIGKFTPPGWEAKVLVHDHPLAIPITTVEPIRWSARGLALAHIAAPSGRAIILAEWPFTEAAKV